MITYLTPKQNEIMLASYLLHKVQVQWRKAQYNEQAKGLELVPITGQLLEISYTGPRPRAVLQAAQYEYPLLSELLPVLYDLADLPRLPQRAGEDATPLVMFLRKLNFTATADLGAGEGVIAAEAIADQWGKVADRTTLLHLRVQTGYIDPDSREEGDGGEYEVIVSAYGQVTWKNITASKLSEAAGTGRAPWHEVNGSHLLLYAWEYLRELHVAIGHVAESERHYIEATGQYETRYRYVRKLPAQEGGESK